MRQIDVESAKEKFGKLLESEAARIERMRNTGPAPDFSVVSPIIVGVIPGDGIGPIIMEQTLRVLRELIGDRIEKGTVDLRIIKGLSIDERVEKMQTLPLEALNALKECHVILKGPMTTPRPGDPWPYLPSAVAGIRRELELNVSLRPVVNPVKKIDWVMFRENIEGAYIWGSKGIQVDDDLAVDFVVETKLQSLHVARMAFEYARKNGRHHVTAVTKVNIVKLTDGNLLAACREIAKEYPEIVYDERLVDITASKLTDPEFTSDLEVLVLPNLYGDIISDIAAEISGGVSTAGSANIGSRYALFEAIHGTAPFLTKNNRGEYADPSSLLKAMGMMLAHIGFTEEARRLEKAMEICGYTERKVTVTSFPEDASTREYTDYILETLAQID
ncbi:MAG: isocitrate/isopropylmalate dehydrogenase family protein [Enterocloster asparagiformis]|nr:isocitrate/isopropylmalate dehydrogenase family protein [Enterocloster asparagiformis]